MVIPAFLFELKSMEIGILSLLLSSVHKGSVGHGPDIEQMVKNNNTNNPIQRSSENKIIEIRIHDFLFMGSLLGNA